MRGAYGVVVSGLGAPARIEPIHVDGPGPGEVLVRVVANGVCHSDLWAIQHGNWGSPFPMLLGHEGAGVAEMVGDDVTHVVAGDPVLLVWAVPCGTCQPCRRGRPRHCAHGWDQPPRLHTEHGRRLIGTRSEERRVGKECKSRWSAEHYNKKTVSDVEDQTFGSNAALLTPEL